MFSFDKDSYTRVNINTVFAVISWVAIILIGAYLKIEPWYIMGSSIIILPGILFDWFVWVVELIWFIPKRLNYVFNIRKREKTEEEKYKERREALERANRADEVTSFVREIRDDRV